MANLNDLILKWLLTYIRFHKEFSLMISGHQGMKSVDKDKEECNNITHWLDHLE